MAERMHNVIKAVLCLLDAKIRRCEKSDSHRRCFEGNNYGLRMLVALVEEVE